MMNPDKAFVLAAGLGTRMRPLTDHMPKPLVKIAGATLLDRALDQLADAGVKSAIINTHYLSDQIARQMKGRKTPAIHLSHEPQLLDTGGGIRQALPYFQEDAFFVLAGDGFWSDAGGENSLGALAGLRAAWDPHIMDILMLLYPVTSMELTQGVGDYDLDKHGRAARSKDKTGAYMFTSIRINHPRIFYNTPEGAFSYLELMDRAEKEGRLYGIVHDGIWHHISTPADMRAVENALHARSDP